MTYFVSLLTLHPLLTLPPQQTLPIAYYPALSDADIDKLLADDKPETVEFMITPAQDASLVDVKALAVDMNDVSHLSLSSFCVR